MLNFYLEDTMKRPACLLALLVAMGAANPAWAGFITGSGIAFYSDNSNVLNNVPTPASFSPSGTRNGMTFESQYHSGFQVDDYFSTTTSETLKFSIGGQSPEGLPQEFRVFATVTGQSQLDFSGLATPGYNEHFFGIGFGVLNYHLAVGDTLNYTFEIAFSAPGFPGIFVAELLSNVTTSTAGDFSVNLDLPLTPLTDLVSLHSHGSPYIQTSITIIASVTRGNTTGDVTVIDFDPDATPRAVPNTPAAVPEPSTLTIGGLIAWGGLLAFRRPRILLRARS